MKRKILASILALSMIFSMVPTAAFADGETGSDSTTKVVENVETVGESKDKTEPVGETPAEEKSKAEEPKAEEPKAEEPKAEEPKAEEAQSQSAGNGESRMMRRAKAVAPISEPTGSTSTETSYVATIGDKGYTTLNDAIANAQNEDTIVLQANVKENVVIPKDLKVTIDLNGKNIENVSDHTIYNNGNLTIVGSGTVNNVTHGKAALVNGLGATATLKGGTFNRSLENGNDTESSGGNSWYTIRNFGDLTIEEGVKVETANGADNNGKFSSLIDNGWYDYANASANNFKDDYNDLNTVPDGTPAKLTIDGGTFIGGKYTVKNDDAGEVTIKGGEFTSYTEAAVLNCNIATISGGTFNAPTVSVRNYGFVNTEHDIGRLTISDGTFNGMIKSIGTCDDINISGGVFNGKIDVAVSEVKKVKITNGTFSDESVKDLIEVDGDYEVVTNADGKFEVKRLPDVAKIGDVGYTSLEKAIAAATDGQTVTLKEDTTEDITIDKNITLDLGGKTLTNTNVHNDKATITVANGATVTIKNGSVKGGALYYNIQIYGTATLEDVVATAGNDGSSMIDVWGNLTINSGTYTGGLNVVKGEPHSKIDIKNGKFELTHTEEGYTAVVYTCGSVTIHNGEFIQSGTDISLSGVHVLMTLIDDKDSTAIGEITVYDGTFVGKHSGRNAGIVRNFGKAPTDKIKLYGGTYNKDKDLKKYLPSGYECKEITKDSYKVQRIIAASIDGTPYTSLEEAYAAAQPGQTIKLEQNVTLKKMLNITKPVNIDGQRYDGKMYTINGDRKNFTSSGNNASLVQVNCPDGTVKFSNVKISTSIKNTHALNVYNSSLVELTDVNLYNFNTSGGAPLIIAGSSVKVSGEFNVTVGKKSWYAINLDERENKIPNLEIDEDATIIFRDNSKKLNFIDTECVNDDVVSAPQIKCVFEYKAEDEAQTPHKVYNLTHGTMIHTEAVDVTCTTDGNVAYWTCETCHKTYSDAEGTTEITKTVIEKLGHKMTKHEEAKATCTEKGMKAYYECSTCGKLYEDEAGTKEVTDKNTLVIDIDATNHKTKFVAEVAAGCEKDGVKAHYECERCGKLFTDAEGKNEVKASDLVIGATGHHWGEWKVVKAATTKEAGIEQAICDYCGGAWQKEIPVKTAASTGTTTKPSNSGSTGTKDNSSSSSNTSSTKENANPTKADTSIADVKRSEEVVSAVKENVKVADEKATVEKDLIDEVKGEKGTAVVLPIASATEETVTSAEIAKDAVKAVIDNGSDLIVELTDATVKLDNETLKAVYEQAEGDSIEIRAVKTEVSSLTEAQKNALKDYETAVLVELQIYSNGKYIANFNGGIATVKIPFTPADGTTADEYTVYYVGGDGKLTAVAAEYVEGYMIVSTGHFSSYAIVRTVKAVADTSSVSSQPQEQTGSSFPIVPVVIAVIALICLFVLLRKKNKED